MQCRALAARGEGGSLPRVQRSQGGRGACAIVPHDADGATRNGGAAPKRARRRQGLSAARVEVQAPPVPSPAQTDAEVEAAAAGAGRQPFGAQQHAFLQGPADHSSSAAAWGSSAGLQPTGRSNGATRQQRPAAGAAAAQPTACEPVPGQAGPPAPAASHCQQEQQEQEQHEHEAAADSTAHPLVGNPAQTAAAAAEPAAASPAAAVGRPEAEGLGTAPAASQPARGYLGPRSFPMTSVVGLDHIKHALLLGAVDPGVGGIIISGGHGVAKSVLARSLLELLPPIEVASASWCNADPAAPGEWEDGLEERLGGQPPDRSVRGAPFVTVPLGVTEDRLLGTVDVEASMKEGRPVFLPGLLAQCHRGVLYVDDLNLLDEGICALLLSTVASGWNTVEREGLSVSHPCKPLLIATYNPEEGELREGVLDRFAMGLCADVKHFSLEERTAAVLAAERFQDRLVEVVAETEEETEALRLAVLAGRESLGEVAIEDRQVRLLVEQAARLGCQGQRAEILGARVARAAAALRGGTRVEAPDLQTAMQLVILPRATLTEVQAAPPPRPPPPPPPGASQQQQEEEQDREQQDREREQQQEPDQPLPPAEFMVGVQEVALDPSVLYFALQQKRLKGKSGRSRNVIFSQDRGRYVKPVFPKGKVRRLAVDATLRAAAPHQLVRRRLAAAMGKAVRKIYINTDDLRAKRLARKSACLVLFVVDASGSMALNRMAAAKGAALRLLGQSYVSRDYVSVLPFHGDAAEVLVPPSRAVALARKRLEVLPCGGGTPLAHALSLAIRMGANAQQKGEVGRCLCVLITDGRANVSLAHSNREPEAVGPDAVTPPQEELNQEVLDMARRLGATGMKLLVIDTESRYISRGFAKEIANAAGGRYHRLPNAVDASAAIAAAAGLAMADAKM